MSRSRSGCRRRTWTGSGASRPVRDCRFPPICVSCRCASSTPASPLMEAEPLQATDREADPGLGLDAYAGSGQPVGPDLWRRVLAASQTAEGARMLRQLLGVDEAAPREFVYEGTSGFQTDASGNAT